MAWYGEDWQEVEKRRKRSAKEPLWRDWQGDGLERLSPEFRLALTGELRRIADEERARQEEERQREEEERRRQEEAARALEPPEPEPAPALAEAFSMPQGVEFEVVRDPSGLIERLSGPGSDLTVNVARDPLSGLMSRVESERMSIELQRGENGLLRNIKITRR